MCHYALSQLSLEVLLLPYVGRRNILKLRRSPRTLGLYITVLYLYILLWAFMTMTLNSAGVKLLIRDYHSSISLFIGKKINAELLYIIKMPLYKFCASVDKYSRKRALNWEVLFAH